MKNMLTLCVLVITAIGFIGCNNNKSFVDPRLLDFKLRLLNAEGQETNVLKQGENFTLSFLIINRSDKELLFKRPDSFDSNFLKVYRIDPTEGLISMGRPFQSFFPDKINGLPIAAHDTLSFEIPWIPDSNFYNAAFAIIEEQDPLPPGKYKTAFSENFTICTSGTEKCKKTDKLEFKVEFEVK